MSTDLAVIEDALESATPGPWEVFSSDSGHSRYDANWYVVHPKFGDAICDLEAYERAVENQLGKQNAEADAELIVLLRNTAAELVERVKAAEAEVGRLGRWQSDALPVMDGLQELGRSLGLILGDSITGPKAHAAAEALKSRAESAEATIARVRALVDEHPGTAWNSGLNLRQALRDALAGPETAPESPSSPSPALVNTERNA